MSSFKKKYQSDPVFRSIVIQKALTKKVCEECGRKVQASNYSRHLKSVIHQKRTQANNYNRVLQEIKSS